MIQLTSVITPATRTFWRGLLIAQKYSPELLLGAGIAGVLTSTVMACRATLKIKEVQAETDRMLEQVEEGKEKIEKLKAADVNTEIIYSDKDYVRDLLVVRINHALRLAKLYGPSVIVGAVSIGAIVGGHHILSTRNAALASAYKILDLGFKKYRKRVIDDLGPEKDFEYRFGKIDEKLAKTGKDEKALTENKNDPSCMLLGDESMYARFFDDSSPMWQQDNHRNENFLRISQNYANEMLKARGNFFLNEVYDMLGIPRSKAGAVVGWIDNGEGDGYIDFGIYNPVNQNNRDFVNGYAKVILLDFNVDGVIYDKI